VASNLNPSVDNQRPYTQRRNSCARLAGLIILTGLVWRLAPLHLPPVAFKFGGSALWAIMVYCLIAACFPSLRPLQLAVTACLIAALVEISRLHHSPIEDAFRLTLAGRLLLGHIFALSDIAAYWIAIMATAAIDRSTAPASTGV